MKTVFTYKQRLFEKLNLKSSTDLIKYAYDRELIPVGSLQDQHRKIKKKIA